MDLIPEFFGIVTPHLLGRVKVKTKQELSPHNSGIT
jgi:hypothetical protein